MRTGMSRSKGNLVTWSRMLTLALVVFGLISAFPISPRGASAEESGTVYLHIRGCLSDYAAENNLDILMANCNESPYYNDAYVISEGIFTKGTPDADNLDWTWSNVPAHNFGIKTHVEPYYAEPTVYCQNGKDDHEVLMQASMVDQYGYVHPTMTGGYVTCMWFAKTGNTNKTASISIDTFDCQPGTNGATSNVNELYSACEKAQDGFTVIVDSPNNGPSGTTSGDEKSGNVYWQHLAPDTVSISGEAILGYVAPRIFCDSGAVEGGYKEVSTGDWSFSYNLVDGEKLTCDWYNVPGAGSTIQINNHLCPGGPDLRTADIYTLAKTCQMNMNGVSFDLTSFNENRSNVTGDAMGSGIKWFDVAAGQMNIHETQFAGYLAPRVFCSNTVIESPDNAATVELPVVDGSIDTPLDAGSFLFCDWFNLPDAGEGLSGTVMVYPMACPDGFDVANSTLQKSSQTCDIPQDLTDFQLVTQNSVFKLTSGWWESGVVIFYGIGTDQDLTLVAKPRDGYETGAVYCGQALLSDGQVGGYDRMPTTDTNTIFPTVVQGSQDICHWFMTPNGNAQPNVINGDATPEADVNDSGDNGDSNGDQGSSDELLWTGRVEITNRVCSVGFDPNNEDVWSNCWEDANGFEFGIYSANQWWPQTSGDWADQMVIWDPVPVQDVIIQGSIPGGFTTPIVYCGDQQMVVSGDGSINLTVNDGEVISCTWFNIQE